MTGSTFTRDDAQRLAELLNGFRPDWYVPETVEALRRAANRTERTDAYRITVAAVRCAANPANGTPARIAEHGHHWQPWPDEPVATPVPAKIQTCEHCGGYLSDTNRDEHLNRRCLADHQAGVYESGAAAAKAALADARRATTEKETST